MGSVGSARGAGRRAMRVWGLSSFDNEAAMKWVEGLDDDADLERVEATLDDVLELEESGDVPGPSASSHVIAAAETIAALAEKPASVLPEEVRQWCFDNPSSDLAEVRAKAVQALGVVLHSSGLREHFDDTGEIDDWEIEVEDLRDRLRA